MAYNTYTGEGSAYNPFVRKSGGLEDIPKVLGLLAQGYFNKKSAQSKKMEDEEERKRKLNDAIKLYELKKQIDAQYPAQPSTSISIAPRSIDEIYEAKANLAMTPEEIYATKGLEDENDISYYAEKTNDENVGILGKLQNYIRGSGALNALLIPKAKGRAEYKFSPQGELVRQQAQETLANPYKKTMKLSGKGITDEQLMKFTGGAPSVQNNNNVDVQKLIEEYNTTTDPVRGKQIEEILISLGIELK